MYIYQNTDYFNFSLDSVLLPNFVTLNKSVKKILDIGCGNAPIPLILSTKTKADIIGVEIQSEIYELAQKSVKINDLEDRIKIINNDILEFVKTEESDQFDVITCNPPFFKLNENSNLNDNLCKSIARHEIKLNLNDIFKVAKKMLKNNGIIGIVHRPERMIEIIEAMRKNNIEPKKIRFVYPKENEEANMLLIEGKKNGNPGLKILPPLYAHESNGTYSKEVLKYFEKE
ncbi:MAG: tRNA1(Val) (adenine(37)-N6)-methyltransferase [Firmicutes bacterium]|nr:tRNA1(Val) (adenine(37)-N6)-methyltransferase [Bacillota bacterium]